MISTEIIKNLLIDSKYGGSGQIISDCPFCMKRGHFYIGRINFLFHCKKCNESGNIYKLLQQLGQLHLLQGAQIDYKEDIKLLGTAKEEEPLDLELPDYRLPVGFKKVLWNSNNVYTEYLKSRKYTKEDFEFYQPGYTEMIEKYEDHVLIPVLRDYSIKGLLARYIGNDETRSRYQNSKNTKFNRLIDGYDQINSNTTSAILIEGHFDKVSVNTELNLNQNEEWKALGTFGKKLSEFQIELLKKTNIKNLCFMYDFQNAVADIKKFGNQASLYFNVYGCYVDTEKDPGDMNKEEILTALNSAEIISSYSYNKVQSGNLK